MTRVWMTPSLMEYCEEMAELIRAVGEKPIIHGLASQTRKLYPFPPQMELPALRLDGLLSPPRIESLFPYLLPGGPEAGSIVQIVTTADFGVLDVFVTLKDEQGQTIERGYALQDEVESDEWYYFPSADFPEDASITVRAVAQDPLGSLGLQEETVTVS